MAYEVFLTPAAESDLARILDYLNVQFGSPQAVGNFLNPYAAVCGELAEHPQMYSHALAPELQARGYRRFLIGKYVALCLVREEQQQIIIARIFHGTQNYTKYI
ncbi:MAG: type II toxin-antitoxin system RelE/ParE family toxin [Pygmaiobacter sp.]|nr:type II toxin-antitoxin system RelE/ParE family toxin [Pygmaiobacter sp.]